jgi:hypothetical protein
MYVYTPPHTHLVGGATSGGISEGRVALLIQSIKVRRCSHLIGFRQSLGRVYWA